MAKANLFLLFVSPNSVFTRTIIEGLLIDLFKFNNVLKEVFRFNQALASRAFRDTLLSSINFFDRERLFFFLLFEINSGEHHITVPGHCLIHGRLITLVFLNFNAHEIVFKSLSFS